MNETREIMTKNTQLLSNAKDWAQKNNVDRETFYKLIVAFDEHKKLILASSYEGLNFVQIADKMELWTAGTLRAHAKNCLEQLSYVVGANNDKKPVKISLEIKILGVIPYRFIIWLIRQGILPKGTWARMCGRTFKVIFEEVKE